MRVHFALLLSLALAASIQANPVQVSISGTADTTEMGYTSGQSYTFNWVVNDGYTNAPWNSFSASINLWVADFDSDALLWTSVSGDGLSGTYNRPSLPIGAPLDSITAQASGLTLIAGAEASQNLGLTVAGENVREVNAVDLVIPALDFSDESYVNPATWLAAYAGVHALSTGQIGVYDDSANSILFSPTQATITVIPEPATMGLIGASVLGLYSARRLKNKLNNSDIVRSKKFSDRW